LYHQLTTKRDQRTVQRENQTQYSLQLLCAEALAQLPCLFSVLEHVRHFVYVQHDLFVCGMNVETALFSVDIDLCINSLMVDIYSHVYSKHVKTQEPSIDMVLEICKIASSPTRSRAKCLHTFLSKVRSATFNGLSTTGELKTEILCATQWCGRLYTTQQ